MGKCRNSRGMNQSRTVNGLINRQVCSKYNYELHQAGRFFLAKNTSLNHCLVNRQFP